MGRFGRKFKNKVLKEQKKAMNKLYKKQGLQRLLSGVANPKAGRTATAEHRRQEWLLLHECQQALHGRVQLSGWLFQSVSYTVF